LPDAWMGCEWASSGLLLGRASSLKTRSLPRPEKGKMSRFSLASLRFRLALLIFLAVLAASGLWLYSTWVDRQWQPPHFLPIVSLGSLLIMILIWLGSDWLTLQRVNLLRQTVQRLADGDLTSRMRLE